VSWNHAQLTHWEICTWDVTQGEARGAQKLSLKAVAWNSFADFKMTVCMPAWRLPVSRAREGWMKCYQRHGNQKQKLNPPPPLPPPPPTLKPSKPNSRTHIYPIWVFSSKSTRVRFLLPVPSALLNHYCNHKVRFSSPVALHPKMFILKSLLLLIKSDSGLRYGSWKQVCTGRRRKLPPVLWHQAFIYFLAFWAGKQ